MRTQPITTPRIFCQSDAASSTSPASRRRVEATSPMDWMLNMVAPEGGHGTCLPLSSPHARSDNPDPSEASTASEVAMFVTA